MTAPLIGSMAPVTLNSTTLAATNLAVPAGIIQQTYQHSGNLFPSVVAVAGAIPKVTFQTPLKDALATIGITQLPLTTFAFYLAKFSSSTYAKLGASAHVKWASTAACAYITGWSIDQNGIALANVEVIPLSTNGSTHALVKSTGQSLPTLGSEPLLHTQGPISINGTVVTGLNSLSVQLNPTIVIQMTDGDLYPRTVAYTGGVPTITGEHFDPETLEAVTDWIGKEVTTNIICYHKSYDITTQLVSVSNSISLTIASGRVAVSQFNETQGSVAKAQVHITSLSSTTSHPTAFSTAATAPST